MQQDVKVGYKYFSYEEELSCVKMTVRGSAEGKVLAAADENGELLRGEADIRLENESQWQTVTIPFRQEKLWNRCISSLRSPERCSLWNLSLCNKRSLKSTENY